MSLPLRSDSRPDGLIATAPGTDLTTKFFQIALRFRIISKAGRARRDSGKPLPNQATTSRQRSESRSTTFPSTIRGTIVQNDAKALYLAPEGTGPMRTVSFASITRLELALDKKRNTWKGAVVGAVIFGLAYGLGAKVDDSPKCNGSSSDPCSRVEAFLGGTIAGGPLALAGFLIQTDRWTAVDPEPCHSPLH